LRAIADAQQEDLRKEAEAAKGPGNISQQQRRNIGQGRG